jgi:hypothetical protein
MPPQKRTAEESEQEEDLSPEDQVMDENESEAGSSKLTLADRKAKMEQLRKRLVSRFLFVVLTRSFEYFHKGRIISGKSSFLSRGKHKAKSHCS